MLVCCVDIDVVEIVGTFVDSTCLVDMVVVVGTYVDEGCLMCWEWY